MSMEPLKVSVIIPVRNQEKHLDACLQSVTRQTLKEIEIIIVEGGSSDGSPEIIYKYMDADPRIHLLNKSGEGLSLARQAGLDRSEERRVGKEC